MTGSGFVGISLTVGATGLVGTAGAGLVRSVAGGIVGGAFAFKSAWRAVGFGGSTNCGFSGACARATTCCGTSSFTCRGLSVARAGASCFEASCVSARFRSAPTSRVCLTRACSLTCSAFGTVFNTTLVFVCWIVLSGWIIVKLVALLLLFTTLLFVTLFVVLFTVVLLTVVLVTLVMLLTTVVCCTRVRAGRVTSPLYRPTYTFWMLVTNTGSARC